MKNKIILLMSILVLLATTGFIVKAGGTTPYDLINEVNGYRLANGLYALNGDPYVMAAAQAHSDWIVETGNGGHIGAGGSDETIRVSWTGYGGGKQVKCDEAWASGSDASSVVYGAWSDWVHQGVMLDYWGNGYTDVGAGVTKDENGNYVFVLDVCLVEGNASPLAPTMVLTPGEFSPGVEPTRDTSQIWYAVVTATPAADGSITHVVQYGQTLVQIALAYGVKVNDIRSLNNIPENSTLIYPEDALTIRKSGSQASTIVTTSNAVEATSTMTMVPTYTPRPRLTRTPMPTLSVAESTIQPVVNQTQTGLGAQSVGIGLIVVCGIALLGFLIFSFVKK